jgi:hypothetical protein
LTLVKEIVERLAVILGIVVSLIASRHEFPALAGMAGSESLLDSMSQRNDDSEASVRRSV